MSSSGIPDPLSPLRVVEILQALLPNAAASSSAPDDAAAPSAAPSELKVKHDVVALLLHAVLLALDFRLIGVGEDGPTEQAFDAKQLPQGWCQGDSYALRYRHTQSSFTFLVKSVRMAKKLLVHGSSIEDGKIYSTQLDVDEHVTSSAAARISKRVLQSGQAYKTTFLTDEDIDSSVFIRPADLIRTFKSNIVEKLIPKLHKEGYEEAPVSSSNASVQTSSSESRRNREGDAPHYPGAFPAPIRPEIQDPLRIGGPMYPSRYPNPDLDPLAAGGMGPPGFHNPFGMAPTGMFVGPDDPMFGYGGVPRPGRMGPPILPPGSVPAGARFDPITPFGPRPRAPGRGGPSGIYFSGDPDPDHLPPPHGYGDMFM